MLKTDKSSIKSDLSVEENSQYETAINQISNVDARPNISLDLGVIEDTSFLQTEHLLQMAFSVADALGDNNESTEMDSLGNLTEKNEFLNICLQDHRILVNQLHSKLSRQVSIHKYFIQKTFFKFTSSIYTIAGCLSWKIYLPIKFRN